MRAGRSRAVRESARLLRARPGGRVLIGPAPRGAISALCFRVRRNGPPFAASGEAGARFEADGFKSVRTLAERDGACLR